MISDEKENINNLKDLIEDENEEESDYIPENKEDKTITFKIEDKSIEEIINLYRKERIVIDSDYQRLFVWNNIRQLRLVDSIFIGMPIPPIWLVRREDRKMEVVDGLQRLFTINKFYNNKLKLEKMSYKELNNKYFKDLDENFKYDFLDATLKLAIINDESYSDKDFIYELFKRINQNTVPLTKQELRNATYLSKFNNEIKSFAKTYEILEEIIPNSKYGTRMKNIEMFYRFLGVFQRYNSKTGKVLNLVSTDERVTNFMKDAANFTGEKIKYYMEILKKAINKVYMVFGKNSFRKWEDTKFKSSLNVPLMEMQLIALNNFNDEILLKNKEKIVNFYKELFADEEFVFSLRAATDSQENTNKRLHKFQMKLNAL